MWGGAATLLLAPAIAMQVTDEVQWTVFDFVFFGAMLVAACSGFDLVTRLTGNTAYRTAAAVTIIGCFLLVWINGAVGIIGSENNPANLMYLALLLAVFTGALIGHFRPRPMARVMLAMAGGQIIVTAIGIAFSPVSGEAAWPLKLLILTMAFVAVWLLAAWLFRRASTLESVSIGQG